MLYNNNEITTQSYSNTLPGSLDYLIREPDENFSIGLGNYKKCHFP